MGQNLSKEDLYDSVKQLVDMQKCPLIHLRQHKLFTLYSIAFQYFLYSSTKIPGSYIFRIEDCALADKLTRKCKDPSTRKFMQSLMIPRKLKYNNSLFYLDFFNFSSWNLTSEIPKEKLKGALIVKNTSTKPMENTVFDEEGLEETTNSQVGIPEDYYLTSLKEVCPKTIIIAFGEQFEGFEGIDFPFIQKDKEKTISGVTLSKDLDWDKID